MIKLYKAHLHDEAPNVGCGQRMIRVKLGWKWVRVKCAHRDMNWTRLRRKTWDEAIAPYATEIAKPKCRVRTRPKKT